MTSGQATRGPRPKDFDLCAFRLLRHLAWGKWAGGSCLSVFVCVFGGICEKIFCVNRGSKRIPLSFQFISQSLRIFGKMRAGKYREKCQHLCQLYIMQNSKKTKLWNWVFGAILLIGAISEHKWPFQMILCNMVTPMYSSHHVTFLVIFCLNNKLYSLLIFHQFLFWI